VRRPDIEGWTSQAEAAELGRLARGRTVLEVGTFKGLGAVLMAQAGARQVVAVDWHRGDADLGPRDTLCAWWTNVRRAHVEDQVVGLVGRSETVLPLLRPHLFELAFIDAAHDLASVRQDIRLVLPLLQRGGQLAFHDYCPTWPGVVRAVDELRERHGLAVKGPAGYTNLRLVDSLAVVTVRASERPIPS
jgi:predicted O-methyltransferase YrrM